ncbi:hypothetical protein N7492_002291 [Penicillium capsulatum]|uniref:Uncharacterized protein n=1 Tax=Penicillium capsulatum TaxID=69766 RepID=A0A9W9LV26_9EURO|nr:hypothetical protein N7492_002291 [Penicillium capsulatum]
MTVLPSDKAPRIVVGLDFGTTFSGVAWALEEVNDIEVIQEWPGGGNSKFQCRTLISLSTYSPETSQKVPSVLSRGEKKRWGYQVGDERNVLQAFRLLLDESKEIRYLPAAESESMIKDMKSTPVQVSGEYLKFQVSHTKDLLDRRFGSALRAMRLDYILTVPAVWSDKAKDATLQAACLAGIPRSRLSLLSEPEAAAVYAITSIQPNTMAKGDTLVVCDAGGGTVDLITYRINTTGPLRLEEVSEGTGKSFIPANRWNLISQGPCVDRSCSTCDSINFLFKKWARRTMISSLPLPEMWLRITGETRSSPSMRGPSIQIWWTRAISFLFQGSQIVQSSIYRVGFCTWKGMPPRPIYTFCANEASNKGVQAVFDPIMDDIEKLVAGQMNKAESLDSPAKAIVLVGGLGASEYLFKRLQQKFAKTRVMQPRNAWSAVVRGAVHRGLEGNQVDNRKARCHYGMKCQQTFDPRSHDPSRAVWCSLEEAWKVQEQMSWFIQKGNSMTEDAPVRLNFHRMIQPHESFKVKGDLHFCLAAVAPSQITQDVSRLCELEADLSKIPKELFELRRNSKGVLYYKVKFVVAMTPTSASLLFDLEFNGISYGTVRSNY